MNYDDWQQLHRAAETLSPERMRAALAIVECLGALGPNALALLVHQAERLRVGAAEYGDWESPRDMAAEALAEAVDGVDYSGIEIMRLERRLARAKELNATFAQAHAQARALAAE